MARMKCSSCSAAITPVVAVDIDGTLADYHGHFIEFAEQYLGRVATSSYDGSQQYKIWAMGALNIDSRTWYDMKLAYRQGAQKRSAPIYNGAAEFMRWLVSDGVEVWVTTTRPYLRLDTIDPDTRAWLNRHRIPYYGLLYDEDKYRRLSERIDRERMIAVLDDLPEHCLEVQELFGDGVAIGRINPYNRAADWRKVHTLVGTSPYTHTMESVRKLIQHRLSDWREQHGEG